MTWPEKASYVPREIRHEIERGLRSMPVVVVTGLRQVGKTFALRHDRGLAKRTYVTLDSAPALEAALHSTAVFTERRDAMTIDEVQRAPDLLLAIKRSVDRDRRPGRFLLSGSADLSLLQGVRETLAGRAVYLVMHPLSRRECARSRAKPFLIRFLDRPSIEGVEGRAPISFAEQLRGGLPPVALSLTRDPDLWFEGYVQTYLERDVRTAAQIADVMPLRRLIVLAALRSAQVLNISGLARDAALSPTTTARYLDLMETFFLIRRLPPYLSNPTARLIKSPKIYFTDTGLLGHLSRASPDPVSADPLRGPLLEAFVLNNMLSILGAHRPRAEIGYWHVQGRHEVDFVVSDGRAVIGVEVKAAGTFKMRDLDPLIRFLESHPEAKAGILAYNGDEAMKIKDTLFVVPISALIS